MTWKPIDTAPKDRWILLGGYLDNEWDCCTGIWDFETWVESHVACCNANYVEPLFVPEFWHETPDPPLTNEEKLTRMTIFFRSLFAK